MIKQTYFTLVGLMALGSLFNTPEASAQDDSTNKGYEIAQTTKERDRDYGDFVTDVTMVLRNAAGQESRRELEIRTLEAESDEEKSIIIFRSPRDVNGTALLSHSKTDEPDSQWLYLPVLKRVKRISSSNKTGSFVGSEFSYEDIGPQIVAKYTYNYLSTEDYRGRECFVVERFSKDPKSGYEKQIFWIDTEEYRVWKVENIDRKGMLLKTLTTGDYKQYLQKHWRPTQSTMKNHQSGKSTILIFKNYQFNTGLEDSDFDRAMLMRLR